ncbi:Homeodomain-like domain-containing protein [Sphingobacterium allocomposti]|uniref:Homeodomain-like domain-containing protein n=1 Tax=Sphingobacterium allocomposti TaxID=415956 RepID=A0A5S5D108_9SPHI|nr:helix-turn-helix domain-containing protein [Sphingobacterium composti Yoo et al. 2007 non Ten et al. 2007]TYP89445.1 Homeodomain-like domain-containing protein [Sphingobacterium composti Yoo et al. 2007 non Ten et al. 2007]
MSHRYPLQTRARAIVMITKGNSIASVAKWFGCPTATVSRWYLDYLGYRGKEGITITLQSRMDDITITDDIIE